MVWTDKEKIAAHLLLHLVYWLRPLVIFAMLNKSQNVDEFGVIYIKIGVILESFVETRVKSEVTKNDDSILESSAESLVLITL